MLVENLKFLYSALGESDTKFILACHTNTHGYNKFALFTYPKIDTLIIFANSYSTIICKNVLEQICRKIMDKRNNNGTLSVSYEGNLILKITYEKTFKMRSGIKVKTNKDNEMVGFQVAENRIQFFDIKDSNRWSDRIYPVGNCCPHVLNEDDLFLSANEPMETHTQLDWHI